MTWFRGDFKDDRDEFEQQQGNTISNGDLVIRGGKTVRAGRRIIISDDDLDITITRHRDR